jgi:hypothetical protein
VIEIQDDEDCPALIAIDEIEVKPLSDGEGAKKVEKIETDNKEPSKESEVCCSLLLLLLLFAVVVVVVIVVIL